MVDCILPVDREEKQVRGRKQERSRIVRGKIVRNIQ